MSSQLSLLSYNHHIVKALNLLLFSAAALLIFLIVTTTRISDSTPLIEPLPSFGSAHCSRSLSPSPYINLPTCPNSSISRDLALALLHFATTPQIPQQSMEEINVTLRVLLQRSPCNFLIFGLWHDSLLWATLNQGGRTVFLVDRQEWIDRMRKRHPQLEIYKVDYPTTLGQAATLLEQARERRSTECKPNQPINESSSCPLSLSRALPRELLRVEWDVILIDGPRSYRNVSFPGRMSPIFTAAVMARTRTNGGHVDAILHDVSRPVEKQYAEEFLCMSNLVSSVKDLWHFRICPSHSSAFCPDSSRSRQFSQLD